MKLCACTIGIDFAEGYSESDPDYIADVDFVKAKLFE
jgi:hypothetical protein